MHRRILALAGAGALTLALVTLVPLDGSQQERQLGTIDFGNSGSESAQGPFIDGVLLMHSFEFDAAAASFRKAQELDPDFALAYWGEAMTYNHPLWRQQDREAALATLARYAPTPSARQAKAPTVREAEYLAAVDVLYGVGSKTERDLAYMGAMSRLSAAYPQDHEARSFHALSILGSTDGERDFATYMRAAAVAQPVFEENPDHPGAAHYIIHSFDDPIHAPLGVEAARAYSEIAPDAGHAQHMTSHIFVALGMWDDVVAANVRARDVQNGDRAAAGLPGNVCGHYTSWLHYGWLMRSDLAEAETGMDECRALVVAGQANPAEVGYYVNMRARHVLDTEDWSAAERLGAGVDRAGYHFVSAYAALKLGERAAAADALIRLRASSNADAPRTRIMIMELEALTALDQGNGAQAMALLREAAALEESLPFEFGPPASLKPPHELLGEVAMALAEHAAALDAFQTALSFTPERAPSLSGLISAASALQQTALASDAQQRLDEMRSSGGH